MRTKIQLGSFVLAIAAAAALPTTVAAESSALSSALKASAQEYQWRVDMRGRPPYKRERVAVEPEVDLAAMEVVTSGETQVIWERAHRGRPPFKRERVELPAVDGAAMELEFGSSTSKTRFRGRPPFKRHR